MLGRVRPERAAALVFEPGAEVEDLDHHRVGVEQVQFAPVDPAHVAVGPERGEHRLAGLDLAADLVDRLGDERLVDRPAVDHAVVDVDADHRAHRRPGAGHRGTYHQTRS